MAAEANNKYAETVTREYALALAKKAESYINKNCFYISKVAEKCGVNRHKFVYILKKFSDDDEVRDAIENMYNKCEATLLEQTGKKRIPVALGIFILKSYHGLIETTKTQHEVDASDLEGVYKKVLSSNEKGTSKE